jgi:predicted aconitase with swiveling domain
MKGREPVVFTGRVIKSGVAEGEALVSREPIGFLGGVDGKTGTVIERGHPLEGTCVAGKVLVFPTGKGSTVGSYVLYELATLGLAPAAIINAESEPIVAVGAIIGNVPMVDQVPIEQISSGDRVRVDGGQVTVWRSHEEHMQNARLG